MLTADSSFWDMGQSISSDVGVCVADEGGEAATTADADAQPEGEMPAASPLTAAAFLQKAVLLFGAEVPLDGLERAGLSARFAELPSVDAFRLMLPGLEAFDGELRLEYRVDENLVFIDGGWLGHRADGIVDQTTGEALYDGNVLSRDPLKLEQHDPGKWGQIEARDAFNGSGLGQEMQVIRATDAERARAIEEYFTLSQSLAVTLQEPEACLDVAGIEEDLRRLSELDRVADIAGLYRASFARMAGDRERYLQERTLSAIGDLEMAENLVEGAPSEDEAGALATSVDLLIDAAKELRATVPDLIRDIPPGWARKELREWVERMAVVDKDLEAHGQRLDEIRAELAEPGGSAEGRRVLLQEMAGQLAALRQDAAALAEWRVFRGRYEEMMAMYPRWPESQRYVIADLIAPACTRIRIASDDIGDLREAFASSVERLAQMREGRLASAPEARIALGGQLVERSAVREAQTWAPSAIGDEEAVALIQGTLEDYLALSRFQGAVGAAAEEHGDDWLEELGMVEFRAPGAFAASQFSRQRVLDLAVRSELAAVAAEIDELTNGAVSWSELSAERKAEVLERLSRVNRLLANQGMRILSTGIYGTEWARDDRGDEEARSAEVRRRLLHEPVVDGLQEWLQFTAGEGAFETPSSEAELLENLSEATDLFAWDGPAFEGALALAADVGRFRRQARLVRLEQAMGREMAFLEGHEELVREAAEYKVLFGRVDIEGLWETNEIPALPYWVWAHQEVEEFQGRLRRIAEGAASEEEIAALEKDVDAYLHGRHRNELGYRIGEDREYTSFRNETWFWAGIAETALAGWGAVRLARMALGVLEWLAAGGRAVEGASMAVRTAEWLSASELRLAAVHLALEGTAFHALSRTAGHDALGIGDEAIGFARSIAMLGVIGYAGRGISGVQTERMRNWAMTRLEARLGGASGRITEEAIADEIAMIEKSLAGRGAALLQTAERIVVEAPAMQGFDVAWTMGGNLATAATGGDVAVDEGWWAHLTIDSWKRNLATLVGLRIAGLPTGAAQRAFARAEEAAEAHAVSGEARARPAQEAARSELAREGPGFVGRHPLLAAMLLMPLGLGTAAIPPSAGVPSRRSVDLTKIPLKFWEEISRGNVAASGGMAVEVYREILERARGTRSPGGITPEMAVSALRVELRKLGEAGDLRTTRPEELPGKLIEQLRPKRAAADVAPAPGRHFTADRQVRFDAEIARPEERLREGGTEVARYAPWKRVFETRPEAKGDESPAGVRRAMLERLREEYGLAEEDLDALCAYAQLQASQFLRRPQGTQDAPIGYRTPLAPGQDGLLATNRESSRQLSFVIPASFRGISSAGRSKLEEATDYAAKTAEILEKAAKMRQAMDEVRRGSGKKPEAQEGGIAAAVQAIHEFRAAVSRAWESETGHRYDPARAEAEVQTFVRDLAGLPLRRQDVADVPGLPDLLRVRDDAYKAVAQREGRIYPPPVPPAPVRTRVHWNARPVARAYYGQTPKFVYVDGRYAGRFETSERAQRYWAEAKAALERAEPYPHRVEAAAEMDRPLPLPMELESLVPKGTTRPPGGGRGGTIGPRGPFDRAPEHEEPSPLEDPMDLPGRWRDGVPIVHRSIFGEAGRAFLAGGGAAVAIAMPKGVYELSIVTTERPVEVQWEGSMAKRRIEELAGWAESIAPDDALRFRSIVEGLREIYIRLPDAESRRLIDKAIADIDDSVMTFIDLGLTETEIGRAVYEAMFEKFDSLRECFAFHDDGRPFVVWRRVPSVRLAPVPLTISETRVADFIRWVESRGYRVKRTRNGSSHNYKITKERIFRPAMITVHGKTLRPDQVNGILGNLGISKESYRADIGRK